MQTNNRKSQPTIPATVLPHAVRGLPRFISVGFIAAEITAAKALLERLTALQAKPAAEHRMRMDRNDAIAFKAGLRLEAEHRQNGREAVDPVINVVSEYLTAYIDGKPLPKIPKALKPQPAAAEVIEVGVETPAATEVAEVHAQ